jgi:predicted nucleotide-binding protein
MLERLFLLAVILPNVRSEVLMATKLDEKAELRKKEYLEDYKALEYWARGGFTSGQSILEKTSSELEEEKDDVE